MDTEMKLGTVLTLDATGERIIKALAQRRYSDLTMQEFNSLRMAVYDDSEGEAELPRSPYHDAPSLIHRREISTAVIAPALGHHGPNGVEGNIWALYDQRHRTRRSEPIAPETAESDSVEDMKGNGEEDFPSRLRPIGLEIVRHDEEEDEEAARAEDILIDDATGKIFVTGPGFAYTVGIAYRHVRKWLQKYGHRRALYRLDDLEAFLESQSRTPARVSGIRRELLVLALNNVAAYRAELKRWQANARQNPAAEAKAIEAVALLDGVAARIGWAEIERLTGLRHISRVGRAA